MRKNKKKSSLSVIDFFIASGALLSIGIGSVIFWMVVHSKPGDKEESSGTNYFGVLLGISFGLIILFLLASVFQCRFRNRESWAFCQIHPIVKLSPFLSLAVVVAVMKIFYKNKKPSVPIFVLLDVVLAPFFLLCGAVFFFLTINPLRFY